MKPSTPVYSSFCFSSVSLPVIAQDLETQNDRVYKVAQFSLCKRNRASRQWEAAPRSVALHLTLHPLLPV